MSKSKLKSKDPIAYVLLSGGIDSSTCLYMAKEAGFKDLRAISIDYGQRHKKEIVQAKEIAYYIGASHHTIKIPNVVPKTMLTDKKSKVPNISYDKIKGVSPTYVPFRNGLMLSVVASYIHGTLKQEGRDNDGEEHALYFGAHAEDARNWAYPDCTPEFIGAMANAIYIGTYRRLRLHTPLAEMNKSRIITEGMFLRVPYELTWSCYKGEKLQCGSCPTCISRREGFHKAGYGDPTVYARQ